MSPVVGSHWVIDTSNGRSAAYRSLRANTTKAVSRFSDFEKRRPNKNPAGSHRRGFVCSP